MTYQRLAYDDAATTAQMTADCRAVEAALRLPRRESLADSATRAVTGPAPSLRYADFPRELEKPGIEVSDAAARLAAALHLHLD